MKAGRIFFWRASLVTGFMVMVPLLMVFAGLQPVSVPLPSSPPPAGGGGDSGVPIISADGRYVVFASTGNNLALLTNGSAMQPPVTPCLNVFVRDRQSATTTLISVNSSGTGGGNGDSLPAGISTNGQFVVFDSIATNMAANDTNGVRDVFVRDTVNNTNFLVSVATNGTVGNGESRSPVMTPDGRYVAFVSAATNLVMGDANKIADVFVRDLVAGTTTLVSAGAQLNSGANPASSSESPVITPDGRYVAFYSTAINLVPGVTTAGEVYVRDLVAGKTSWVSTNALSIVKSVMGSTVSGTISYDPQISSNGQYVAFVAKPTTGILPVNWVILRYNLQTGLTDLVFTNVTSTAGYTILPTGFEPDAQLLDLTPDGRFIAFVVNTTNSTSCIYQWDALNMTNVLVSGNLAGGVTAGTAVAFPVQTPDGRYVAFYSNDTNLTAALPPASNNLYVRDTQAGVTAFADNNQGLGLGADPTLPASVSSDGRFIAFERTSGNAVPNDNTQDRDVFITDLTQTTTGLVSAHHPALASLTPNGSSLLFSSSVSTNGRYVAFASSAANLTPNNINGCRNVFVHDFLSGTNILVSLGMNGAPANGLSTEPAMSANGRFVAFTSYATNLVAGDNNNDARNVFLRDLQSGTTVLVSVSTTGGSGNGDSYEPTVSSDGRYVLFRSLAQNLTAGSFVSGNENLFLRDQIAGQTYALTTNGLSTFSPPASMTPDGHFVAFFGPITASSNAKLYLWNSALAQRAYTNSVISPSVVSITPDGQNIACLASAASSLTVVNVPANTTNLVSAGPFPSKPGLTFSSDGRFLAYATSAANVSADTNSTQDIYVYDSQIATNLLISWNSDYAGTPNGVSDSPCISSDGRFVTYRSFASNIVTNDFNGVPDIFLFDRVNNVTTLLSADPSGNFTANNRSVMPVFSGDGLTLVFQSWASDLVTNDFNNSSDILAYDLIALPGTGLGGFGATNSIPPFSVQMNLTGGTAQTPVPLLSWPLVSGQSYQAQYKDNVGDATWQNVNGGIIFIGGTGYINDLSPSGNQRFYRIVLNNN